MTQLLDDSAHPWRRLIPPRRPRGDSRNVVRARVVAEVFGLNDEETRLVADAVVSLEAGHVVTGIDHRLVTTALTIIDLKQRYPDAWR